MPRIKNTGVSATYAVLDAEARQHDERNDCTVKAVAAATGKPYAEVHALLARLGRKNGRGTSLTNMRAALTTLGFTRTLVNPADFIERYPRPHRDVLQSVTTHHPERFNKVWRDGCTYILFTSGWRHTLAVINGNNADWTKDRAKRIVEIWLVKAAS
jgi:hypothetical protein